MGALLNQPFVSEAYDRLMEAQAAFVPAQMVEPVDYCERLKAVRLELGLTQAALGARLGIDAPAVSKMENGEPIKGYIDLAIRYLLVEHRG